MAISRRKSNQPRKRPVGQVEADILFESRRRCALCYGLYNDLDQKHGQIAHIDRDRSNSVAENLCFLCLPHHDEYDTKTSQSKRFTPEELRRYKEQLYERLARGVTADQAVTTLSSLSTIAREQACVEIERDAGYLVERLGSWARLEPDVPAISEAIYRLERNVGLIRRDQTLTQAVRDFAHQCKIILTDKGMFDQPAERPAETAQLRGHFDRLIRQIDRFVSPPSGRSSENALAEAAPFFSLVSGSSSAGLLDFHMRNDGAPVTCLTFESTTAGSRIREWTPPSLPTGAIFRASVRLGSPEPALCEFRMQVRDRLNTQRTLEFRLNRETSPQLFDFSEL